ncbi:MAG: hypothetical protein V3V35_09065 [Dehalococcoidia bacterium]
MKDVVFQERSPLPALLLAAIALLFLALAAACDGDDSSPATPTAIGQPTDSPTPTAAPTTPVATPSPSPSPTSPTPTASPTPAPTPFDGTRGPVEKLGSDPVALLTDVRTGRHPTFDRIVFEFQDNVPGYRIEYVEPPILQDASGLPVEIAGSAFLQVRFNPAAAHDPVTGEPTYTGPREIADGLPALVEAEQTGDFEAYVTWVLGLTEETDFKVSVLQDPFRLVIDVAHP